MNPQANVSPRLGSKSVLCKPPSEEKDWPALFLSETPGPETPRFGGWQAGLFNCIWSEKNLGRIGERVAALCATTIAHCHVENPKQRSFKSHLVFPTVFCGYFV